MALIGNTTNQKKLQGIIKSCKGALSGDISSDQFLGGQVQGIRGYKGEKGDKGDTGDSGVTDVKVHNKLSASDTTAYNSIVDNGVAQLYPGLLGNVGVVMEATDTAASQAMKHLMFKSNYSSGMRLADGGIVLIKFMADVYNSATLNLHLQDAAYTGDIPIYDNGSAITMGKIMENDIVALMYDDRNTRFNIIGKSYKPYTSTSNGLVPPSGVPSSDEMKILTHRGWQTIVTYNYSTLDAFLEAKAFTTSPTFTGTPKAPTAASGTDTTQIATTAFVQDAISGVGGTVDDVQIDGTSIVSSGIATIPKADANQFGLVKIEQTNGEPPLYYLKMTSSNGQYQIPLMLNGQIKPLLMPEATTTLRGAMKSKQKNRTLLQK